MDHKTRIVITFLILGGQIINSESISVPPFVSISFSQDLADVDFLNASLAIMTNSYPGFTLHCNASYPVEWILFYNEDDDEFSEQKNITETRRIVSNFENRSSYIYSAQINLQFRGKLYTFANFSCKAVGNPDLQTHVITTTENRRNVILLHVTSDKKYIMTQPKAAVTKDCPVIASVSDMRDDSSCWRCEKSNGTELELDFIGCTSAIQCNSNYVRQNQGQICLKMVSKRATNETCKRIGGRDYNPKILVCKNFGPVLAQFYYFGVPRMGKTPQMFFDWSQMDPNQMMYIHQIDDELYYDQNLTITCEMSKYYFAYGSWFGLEMEYGNEWDEISKITYIQTYDEDQEDWKASFASELNLTLTFPVPSKVYCFAPVWNSTEWINASVKLNVQLGEKPQIWSVFPMKSEKFEIGQNNRSIICRFSGKPSPRVEWFGPIGSFYKVDTDNSTNSSELFLPEVTYATVGEYRCRVVSFLGSDMKQFSLQASYPLSSKVLKSSLAIGGVVLVLVGTIVVLVVVRLCRIVKAQREALRLLTEAEIKEFVDGNPSVACKNDYFDSTIVLDALPYDKKYEIPQDKVYIDYKLLLGTGAFGKVYKGKIDVSNCSHYLDIRKSSVVSDGRKVVKDSFEVAIKTCEKNVDVVYFKAILTEIKVMGYIGHHKNIVGLVGACTKNIRKREVYIVVEFCPKGSLESYLRRQRNYFVNMVQYGIIITEQEQNLSPNNSNIDDWIEHDIVTTKDLFKWSFDIACGMEYLHEKKVIHGDLAARNILLMEDLVAKIGDFGLARQLLECSNYVKKTQCPLPWRYLAPESLRDLEFSVKSDIWAYGITLWEIFTLSEIPYPGISWSLDFLSQLENGFRLSKPIYATNDLYEFMLKCWKINTAERPDFAEIKILCSNSLKLMLPTTLQEYVTVCDNESPHENVEGYLVPNPP